MKFTAALPLLTLLLLTLPAMGNELMLKPRLCVQHADTQCVLNMTVSWQLASPACLYQQDNPDQPLLCQQTAQQLQLAVPLTQNTQFILKDQQSGAVIAKRQVKVLQVDFKSGEQLLNKTHNGWWQP